MEYKNHWLSEKQKKSLPEVIQIPDSIMVYNIPDKIELKLPMWDFETALAETVKEKYGPHIIVIEIKHLNRRGDELLAGEV